MGRAMLIIMAGVIVALGYIGLGTAEQGEQIIARNAGYANMVMAKNSAYTAIQMAMQKMNEDSTWAASHGEGNPWTGEIEGYGFSLHVEYVHDSADYWAPDTIRVVSASEYSPGEDPVRVISVYEMNSLDYVPDFKSPLTIATENFSFKQQGNSKVIGYEQSGTAGCEDKPGITTMSSSGNTKVTDGSIDVSGDPPIQTDTSLSYQPTDQLIARLEDLASTQYITGTYKGSMGTEENPGVFFVEEDANLTGGIPDGYGILVIRSGGELGMVDSLGASLDIAGNFTFNGLVVFENAWDFKGTGTPTINGSVLVGNTENSNQMINIDLNGTLNLNYDCTAEAHAKKAASLAVSQNKYKRITTFE